MTKVELAQNLEEAADDMIGYIEECEDKIKGQKEEITILEDENKELQDEVDKLTV